MPTATKLIPALAALALLPLAGCKGSASTRAHEEAQESRQQVATAPIETVDRKIEHDAIEKMGYQIEWRGFPFKSSRLKVEFFDIFGDVIVVQDDSSTVTVMDPVTGRNRWSTKLAGSLTRFVGNARRGGDLLCASDTSLYTLDIRTGTITDKDRLAVVVNTPPLVVGHMAVFGCSSGELLGHNLLSGYKQWGYLFNGSIFAHPVTVGEGVGAVSQGGDVIIVDPRNGSSFGRGLIYEGLTNNPVAGADTLYVASKDQSVYAFDAATGDRLWRQRTEQPITDQPAAHNGILYVTIPGQGLVAINGATGDTIWTAEGVRGEPIGISKGRMIIWDGDTATLIDARRGDVIESVSIPNIMALRMTSFVDGDLFAVTPKGAVAKYTAIDN